ncbi:MAG: hypothetical protein GF331_26275 [Chitinivibrionales bacterium]|nr:hypothetical protein [Chitinivibrionales bacterium]
MRNTLTLLLMVAGSICAAQMATLEIPKARVLPCEPLYVTIRAEGANIDGVPLVSLENDANPVFLSIVMPDGTEMEYVPPARFMAPDLQQVARDKHMACVVLSRGKLVTREPGNYAAVLKNRCDGEPVSNVASFSVSEAGSEEDREGLESLRKHSRQFAWFMYLDGGEHLKEGLETCLALANGESSYASVCKAVLSINYSAPSYDVSAGKLRRDKDAELVEKYFPPVDGSVHPGMLRKAIDAAARGFGVTLPAGLSAKLTQAANAAEGW